MGGSTYPSHEEVAKRRMPSPRPLSQSDPLQFIENHRNLALGGPRGSPGAALGDPREAPGGPKKQKSTSKHVFWRVPCEKHT